MIGENLRVLLWKELLDLSRDYKTLATSILLPLAFFPLLGLISLALVSQQPINVAIIDLDNTTYTNEYLGLEVSSHYIVEEFIKTYRSYGVNVITTNNLSIIDDPSIDLVIVIPKGFTYNVTSINTSAYIRIYKKAALQSSAKAESIAYAVIDYLKKEFSKEKVEALIKLLGINASVKAFLEPIVTTTTLVTVTGGKAGIEEELRATLARILVLALSVVMTPATSFMIDGIIGERERKTIEMVLSLPISVQLIIYAKLVAATLLGLLTAVADALGFLAYMILLGMAFGTNMFVLIDPWLLVLHSIVAFFTILVTISIALPFITRTRGIRSAANIASAIAIIGTMVFFTGFIVDYSRLASDVKTLLYFIPYTHSVLSIQYYVLGNVTASLTHIAILVILSTTLLAISLKIISTEKLLVAPKT